MIPAAAVTIIAFCVAGLADDLNGTRVHSGGVLTVLGISVVMIVTLGVAAWITIATARSVLRPLYRLRDRALEVASRRPSETVEHVDGSDGREAPSGLDVDSPDEIGDVARAFEQMRGELLRMRTNEAAIRSKLDAMFVNLSHRGQSLVERQIRLMENLEQGEQDRERLAYLARMSRIASRIHRNSQNLLVLAGHELSSGWNQPMPLVNVIRAAVSEIEECERVSLHAQPDIAVAGPVVNDVAHLLAELTENATSFSAVDMPVEVSSHLVSSGGVVIDITDRGVGIGPKELAYANWRLENPPAADLDVPKWIGLFVVARLAARHGIRVRLQQAEFGGLTALVWLPDEVLIHQAMAPPPRPVGYVGATPKHAAYAAAGNHAGATVGRKAAMAIPTEVTQPHEDTRSVQFGRQLIADAGRRPGPAWQDVAVQPRPQADRPATAEPSGLGSPAPGVTGSKSPVDAAAQATQETSSAEAGVVVPSGEDLHDTAKLPIFEAVESGWFTRGRKVPVASGGTSTDRNRWSSPADDGWQAAETVETPAAGAPTAAGLPRRLPNANLIPGTVPGPQPRPSLPSRSAAAARDRLAGYQRGVSEGRAAAGEAAAPGTAADDGG